LLRILGLLAVIAAVLIVRTRHCVSIM
jgi:hypothetical protein